MAIPPVSGVQANPANLFNALGIAAARATHLAEVERSSAQMLRLLEGAGPRRQRDDCVVRLDRLLHSPHDDPQELSGILGTIAESPLLMGGFQAVGPELAAQLGRQVTALKDAALSQVTDLREVDAVRTALMATRAELLEVERQPYAANYRGIRQYRKAVAGRLKDLARIETAFSKHEPMSPRLQERWERFRMSHLGEKENGYRGKVQQHLDLLREAVATHQTDDPLLTEMLTRQGAYVGQLRLVAETEKGNASEIELGVLQENRYSLERSYHDAVEAYYFLKGYMPTTWAGSFQEMTREFRWGQPSTWVTPLLLGGLTTFIGSFGIEPTSWDGAIFPSVRKKWEDGVLVIEPRWPTRRIGMSRRALGAALLDTLRLQLALVNTTGIDPTGGNFEGFIPHWLQTVVNTTNTTVRVEGLGNLKGLRDENLILASTHRGFIEYPVLLGLQDEIGRPYRIVAKESFRTNPVIRGLVGLAMERYDFFFIDRSAGADARGIMVQAGKKMRTGTKSFLTYPSGSRSPTLVFDGERVEGPHYGAKHGVGFSAEAAGDPAIVPIAVIGSGRTTPKAIGEQARGVPLGRTITVRIGKPFRGSSVRIVGGDEEGHAHAIAARIDEEFRDLTGLPTGPLYRDKRPKTIFQADNYIALELALKKRLKDPKRYRHSAVVFPPGFRYQQGDAAVVFSILRRLKFPVGQRLTVFHTTRTTTGRHQFQSYDVIRRSALHDISEFEIVRGNPPPPGM